MFTIGPMRFDLTGFVGLRLNEHALHTWDIDVALDNTATIPADLAALVVDNLELIARYIGKPHGEPTSITIRTIDPERTFTLTLTNDGVRLEPGAQATGNLLEMPSEAFARLVYGRLDRDHTPIAIADDPTVARLRHTFPGPDPLELVTGTADHMGERDGYRREPERDWKADRFDLLAYRLDLS